jgi:hypothetical protein
MDNTEKVSLLQFAVGRFDHYYDSINNKGNVYLALNSVLLVAVVTAYYALFDKGSVGYRSHLVVVAILICNLFSSGFTLSALYPYRKKTALSLSKSLFWFGDISCDTTMQYAQRWNQADEPTITEDLVAQTHTLACGLQAKFRKLRVATWFLMIELAFIAIVGLIKFK